MELIFNKIIVIMVSILLLGCDSKSKIANCLGYSDDDVVFIINADDVGMHKDIDLSVYELYKEGKIQSFSLMVPAPNFLSSAQFAIDNEIPVGIHLTLTNEWQELNRWSPVLSKLEVPSLYNHAGLMWASNKELYDNAEINEMEKEIEAQIKKALDLGLNVSHLDFHMVFWLMSEDYVNMIFGISKEYKIPIVTQLYHLNQEEQKKISSEIYDDKILSSDVYWMYYNPDVRIENSEVGYHLYNNMFRFAKPGLHHVAIHPSFLTAETQLSLKDADFRFDEYKIWIGNRLNETIKNNDIKFTNYGKMKNVMSGNVACVMD
ncbi:polysaccharide deacetylase family protein [Vibrio metschnikovii]|uniref:polysaccharide deacetylase family protein n=1 Tax=Vibrio metschnikovii TaxID=28172 RepID=UPI00164775EA|nr:polysaccharide deacetylase family protein [Vibrio metschnikovii]MBC3620313.1 polysaccharide deacetylase family protein [Vibrio metschnikovii]